MAEKYAKDTKLRESWDRLALLLIDLPREGWEHEFWEISQRQIHRLASPKENEAGHDGKS